MNQEKKIESNNIPENEQTSYRQIFKATSLFGGVQVINIIVSVIRSKFVAILLGPSGMGIVALLNSTTTTISSITNFGLRTSAVKDVSAAVGMNDQLYVAKVIKVLKKLVWLSGMLGMLVTIVLSPWLSEITFGNNLYTYSFIFVSVTLLLNQLSAGQMVVLQGLRRLKYLAKSSTIGLLIGLIFTIPIYYFWGVEGIVPVIIITSVTGLALSFYYSRKVNLKEVLVAKKEVVSIGSQMFKLGVALSLNGIIISFTSYLLRIYISNEGTIEDVGLYGAGFAIINTYFGMVFTAMATDYFPRLSEVSSDFSKSRSLINQQAEVAILILAPILAAFLLFVKWAIIILYSLKFTAINELMHWAAIGIFLKAASWSVAFIFVARGDTKLFFWNELVSNAYSLLFNIMGYKFAGLEGLGISFLCTYVIYMLQVYIITNIKYKFYFSRLFYKISIIQLIICTLCFVIVRSIEEPYSYVLGSILIAISIVYSYKELDKRVGIKEIILNLRKRKK